MDKASLRLMANIKKDISAMAKPICVKKKKMFVKTKWLSAKSCKILAHFDKGELWKVFYGQDNMGLEQLVKSAF